MSEIRRWLNDLGLGQYAEAFEANDIDARLLPQVDDQALKDIGVASTGHRLRIRAAIAALDPGASAQTRRPGSPAASEPVATAAERRQLTVMFCDLVGSTELSQHLDPEQYRELVRGYQTACAEIVRRYDGHIAQYLGDGVLVYFGYPAAHEDDAQRAVRAGLETADAVSRLSGPDGPLAVRVGIHTGLVVVGDVGSGEAQAQLALGDTPNLAARIESLAGPGAVVLSDRTHGLAGGAFDYQDLGARTLKGVAESVHVWQALRESRVASRFDAAIGSGISPMVGRQLEYSLAIQAWERARSGRGQAVMLCGEPGIGKSRILRALREAAVAQGVRAWQYQCSPYFVNSTLYPVIDHLERAMKFERDESPEVRLDRLAELLASYGRPPLDANLLARLLNLPAERRFGALSMSPQRQKEETLRALNDVTVSAASRQPVLMLLEDLHWADPTTLELLEALLERLDRVPVMLLATFRPEYKPRWLGHPGVIAVTLTRLDAEQTREIATRVARKPLPPEIVQQVVAKTDGIPLFVEELTKAILESNVLEDRGNRYELVGPLTGVAIPGTLRDSLTARLDRLGPAKEVAQVGACIGREFRRDLLALVSPMDEVQLELALRQLSDSELVFRRGEGDRPSYVFKHALVQDAAYDSLLKRRRAQIHEQIAHALEARFPDVQEDEPELLAHHYTGAELPEQAIPYWRRAGELAVRRLALQDAIAHLDRGMVLVKQLAPSRERDVAELELRALSGIAWQLLHGWTVPQARDHAEAAWALAKSLGRTDHMIRILWTLWVYYVNDGHIREAVTWVNQLIAEGRRLGSDAMELAGHAAGTCASHFLAEWDAVFRHADQVEAGYDLSRHRVVTDLVAFDPLSTACSFKALAQWKTGFPDQATATSELATRHARAIGHGSNQCFVLLLACGLHYYRRDQVRLKEAADELDRVAQEHGLGYYAFFQVPNQRARLLLLSGDFAQAESAYRAAIELRERFGQRLGVGATSTIQAICAASLGHHGAALRFLDEAIAQIERPGWEERTDLAEVLRVKGWVHTLAGDLAAAERNYRASLEVARAQRATSWELRTATSLARLWQRQGKQKAAHELLAPVYNWFTEGFETKDLKEAKALLEDLSRC